MRIGVISDTHGLLRPEAVRALRGADRIVHAGDVGGAGILAELATLAPITAVRGNVDRGVWARALPATAWLEAAGTLVLVVHDLGELDLVPEAAGIRVVVSGHTHRPSVEERRGVLYLNPGSAGPARFRLPVTLAMLQVDGSGLDVRIVDLAPRAGGGRRRAASPR